MDKIKEVIRILVKPRKRFGETGNSPERNYHITTEFVPEIAQQICQLFEPYDEEMEAEFAWRRGEETPDNPQPKPGRKLHEWGTPKGLPSGWRGRILKASSVDSVNKPESRLLSEKEMPE